MFTRFVKPAGAFKAAGFGLQSRLANQARFLATVEGSAGRAMPITRPKATPVSHDRATFTIRVCWNQLAGWREFLLNFCVDRMDPFSMANPLVLNPIFPVKLSLRLPLSDTLSL